LQSFFLPPTWEVIDSSHRYFSPLPHFSASARSHFCVAHNCLMGTADHKVILYMGDSPTFSFCGDISILSDYCFARNDRLQSIVLDCHACLKSLPARAFAGCGLHSIAIPKSVLVIGEQCFENCSELTTVSFESPAGIRRIDSYAFCKCSSLTSFTVPSSVSTLGKNVFS
jgi:hypothetical protein